jgi:hypothetical protein
VPDQKLGFGCLCVLQCPLQVDDVLADREWAAKQQAEAVFPRRPTREGIRRLDSIDTSMGAARW